MSDYKNGKIYKIVCEITGEVYIGSTRLSLEDRLKYHLKKGNQTCSKQIIDRNKYYIEQLESYPCNNEHELRVKEGEYQRAFKCINRRIECRTLAEWREDNKEYVKECHKQYNQDNKERCNKISNQHYQDNKEYYKKLAKQYRLDNSLEIAENDRIRKGKEVICECGVKCTKGSLSSHKRSKKHIDLMSKLTQPYADLVDEGTPVCYRVGRI